MTKSRKKKKNYKLRRRVKRTIAALVMIMAIVIAAIPVENLGTMRAAANGEQLTVLIIRNMRMENLDMTLVQMSQLLIVCC